VSNNKPDIIIRDNEKGTCVLMNVAILGDRNVIKKVAEIVLNYKDITTETQPTWNVKTEVIPVIIRATGSISKSFTKYLSNLQGTTDNSHTVTAHVLRKVLM
jgi:glyoxylate utilization-related uncharacterized protein